MVRRNPLKVDTVGSNPTLPATKNGFAISWQAIFRESGDELLCNSFCANII